MSKLVAALDFNNQGVTNVATPSADGDLDTVGARNSAVSTAIGALPQPMVYKGVFDASAGDYTAISTPSPGWVYRVSVAGTIGAHTFGVGDELVINSTYISGTVVDGNVDQFDPGTLRTTDIETSIRVSGTAVDTKVASEAAVRSVLLDNLIGMVPVIAIIVSNIDLATNGLSSISGYTPSEGDTVAVTGQTTTIDNGLYVAHTSGGWLRLSGWGTGEYIGGRIFQVQAVGYQVVVGAPYDSGTSGSLVGTDKIYIVPIFATDKSATHVYDADVGDGTNATLTVTHNLGTKATVVSVYDNTTPYEEVLATVKHTDTNTITLTFGTAPTSSQYHCVVIG